MKNSNQRISQKTKKAVDNSTNPINPAAQANHENLLELILANPHHERKDHQSPTPAHKNPLANLPHQKEKGAVNKLRLVSISDACKPLSAVDVNDDAFIAATKLNIN